MRLHWILAVVFLGCIIPCHSQFSGFSLEAGKDLIKNMTDTEVFSLLGDVIFRNPSFTYIFHKLEEVPFSLGPLLSPPSLRTDILNKLLLWVLDRLPSWVENPHLVNAYHILVKNINAVNTTGLPSGPNDFVIGLFNRTDFVKMIKEILKSEGANITDMIGLKPDLAQIILPWTIDNVANIVKTDGPVLLKILVQELNAVNMTGINTSDPTDVVNGIRMRFNYLELLKKVMKLKVFHAVYSVIGLNPDIGDTVLPALLNSFGEVLDTIVEQLNEVNLTSIFSTYGVNVSNTDIVHAIDYIEMIKHYLVPKYGKALVDFLKTDGLNLLKLVVYEANRVPKFLIDLQFPGKPLQGFLHYFDFEDLLTKILEQMGNPIFSLVGLNPEIGKHLASIIAKDVPDLLKITIAELNKIDVTTLENVTSSLTVLEKVNYTSLISTFAVQKGMTMTDFFGIPINVASFMIPWAVSHTEYLVRSYGVKLFSVLVDEINHVNMSHIATTSPDAFMDDLIHRLNWKSFSLKTLSVVAEPLFRILNIDPDIGLKMAPLVLNALPSLENMASALLQNLTLSGNTSVTLDYLIDHLDLTKPLSIATPVIAKVLHLNSEVTERMVPLITDALPYLQDILETLTNNVTFKDLPKNASNIMVLMKFKDNLLETGKKILYTLVQQFLIGKNSQGNPQTRATYSAMKAPRPLDAETCGVDTTDFINQLFAGKNWALKMLDAAGKPPPGILTGSLHMIGSYDECVGIPKESGTDIPYGTRYCRLAFNLPRSLIGSLVGDINLYGMQTTLSFGVCLPDTCGKVDVSDFFTNNLILRLFNIAPMSVYCSGPPDLSEDTDALVTIAIAGIIVILIVIATLIHIVKWRKKTKDNENAISNIETSKQGKEFTNGAYVPSEEKEYPESNGIVKSGGQLVINGGSDTATVENDVKNQNGENESHCYEISDTGISFNAEYDENEETKLHGVQKTKQPELIIDQNDSDKLSIKGGLGKRLILAFSAIRNLTDVMSFRRNSNHIHCIHGIRFITMSWIILGNTYIYSILPVTDSSLASDLLHVVDILKRFTFQAVVGATLGTDTFFMISGCLMAYAMLCKFEKKGKVNLVPLLCSFFHRYWRLTPSYMIFLAIFVYLYQYIGNGPNWPEAIDVADECRANWWHHLLHINNIVGIDGKDALHQCMVWGWFVAALMQFYLITPFFIGCMLFSYRLGALVVSLMMIAGVVSAGIKENDYGGDLLSMMEDNGAYWNNVFIPPWCRVSTYCVGLLLGMILYQWKDKTKKVHMAIAILGWILSVGLGIFIVYISYTKYQDASAHNPWSNAQLAAYEALARPVWTVCVAWVVFTCFTGYGGYVDSFLSWEGFLPLSKLTYAAYLINPVWIVFQVYSKRTLLYLYSDYEMMYIFIGHLVMVYGASLLICIAFELPFIHVERALFKKK